MNIGDQVICTCDYITHDGRKLFSVGDVVTISEISLDNVYIMLKDSEDFLKMKSYHNIFITDYCGEIFFKFYMTKEQQKLQKLIPEETQHLLINSLIKHPLNLVCNSNCGEFDLDFALREYCRMGKIILDNAVKHNYDKSYDDKHLVKSFDNLRYSLLSYYTMIINNAHETMILEDYYNFFKKLRDNIVSLSHVYTEDFDGGALSSDIIFCLSSTNFQLKEQRLKRIKKGTVEHNIHSVHPFYPD